MDDQCNPCQCKPPVSQINPEDNSIGSGRFNHPKAPFKARDYETTIAEVQCVIAWARERGFSIMQGS